MMMLFAGCQTMPRAPVGAKTESPKEIISAVSTVTEGITNKSLTEQDMKNLAVQVQKDPQAQSAVKAVNSSFNVQDHGVKYCPVDGKRFSSVLDICPEHKVKLKQVE